MTEARAPGVSRRSLLTSLVLAGTGAALATQRAAAAADIAPPSQAALYGHLLRRAGFGLAPGELSRWQGLAWEDAVDKFVAYEAVDNSALEQHLNEMKLDLSKPPDLQRWWLMRMIHTARPLEEKMVLFWHGLLTSGLSRAKPPLMLAQQQFLREHALADFGTILKGISRDPAMMLWLDTINNRKGHPNENYARELMELFSMGVGNYTEQDIRESARAFTGLILREDKAVFVKRRHDDGVKTFLGRTGRWGPDDIVDIILAQAATAPYVARRLLRFFLMPSPPDSTVDAIARVLGDSGYSLKAAVRALFLLPEFRSPEAQRALVKSPAEYAAGALRQLGAVTAGPFLPGMLTQMGQTLFNPPNVAGWPGGRSWFNSGTWLARLNFANLVTTSRALVRLEPGLWTGGQRIASPAGFVDVLVAMLLDGNIAPDQRQVLVEFAGPPQDLERDPRRWFDGRGRALVYLLLGMPEYHLN